MNRASLISPEVLEKAVGPLFDEWRDLWIEWDDPITGRRYQTSIEEWNVEQDEWSRRGRSNVWIYTEHPERDRDVTLFGQPTGREMDTVEFDVHFVRMDPPDGSLWTQNRIYALV